MLCGRLGGRPRTPSLSAGITPRPGAAAPDRPHASRLQALATVPPLPGLGGRSSVLVTRSPPRGRLSPVRSVPAATRRSTGSTANQRRSARGNRTIATKRKPCCRSNPPVDLGAIQHARGG